MLKIMVIAVWVGAAIFVAGTLIALLQESVEFKEIEKKRKIRDKR